MNSEKRKRLCIAVLVLIFILFFIVYISLPKGKRQIQKEFPYKSAVSTVTASAAALIPTEKPTKLEECTNNEKIETLKRDAADFLNAYTMLTDGTYEKEKEKYDLLKSKMTPTAVEYYLNEAILKDPSSFSSKAQKTVSIINRDISVYYSMSGTASNKANVCILCNQVIQSSNIKSEYPYQLIGVFKYESSNTWKCNTIEASTAYSIS